MTVEAQTAPNSEQKQNDKEYNFRALEAKFQRQLEQERAEKEKIARELEEIRQKSQHISDEDDDSEPYVDRKRLKKEQAKFGQQIKQETQSDIQNAVQQAIYEERKKSYLENHKDFFDTIQKNAEKLLQKDPELADTILQMPDNFERQKLVYQNIKALGLDKPETKAPSIQEKIDANRRMPYYQPTGMNSPPFASASDFSQSGQKNAYEKMQELKTRLRLG